MFPFHNYYDYCSTWSEYLLTNFKKYHIALLKGGIQQRRRVQKIMRNVCRTKVLCNTNRYSAFLTSFSGNPQIADGLCANPEKTDNIVIQQTSRHIRRKKCWIFRTLLPKRNQVSIAPNRKDMWVINEFSTNILNYQRNHLYAKWWSSKNPGYYLPSRVIDSWHGLESRVDHVKHSGPIYDSRQ